MKPTFFGVLSAGNLQVKLNSINPRVGLVVRVPKIVTSEDCSRGRSHAERLREHSAPMVGREVHQAIWTRRWPGTEGPLVLHVIVENPFVNLDCWRTVLASKLGFWQDLQVFDKSGLLGFAVTHENLVYVRKGVAPYLAASEFQETEAMGTAVSADVLRYLFEQ